MRKLVVFAALLASSAVQAGEAPKPKGELGSSWTNKDGNTRNPQVGFLIEAETGNDADIYRPITLDWRRSNMQKGRYPGDIDNDQEGSVDVRLDITGNGNVEKCEIIKASDIAAFNSHACPHLQKYAHFFPAMDNIGKPVSKSYQASLRYTLIPRISTVALRADEPSKFARLPRELVTADAAMIGIDANTPNPQSAHGISASLNVDENGFVTGCTLYRASYVDSLDRQICDRLMANMRYNPAILKDSGTPTAARSSIYISWPKPSKGSTP